MKLVIAGAVIGAVLVAAVVACVRARSRRVHTNTAVWRTSGPSVESIQRVAELCTIRVSVADVLTGDGYGYRGVWIVKGDAVFGIDADRIRVPNDSLDEIHRTATVVLPRPSMKYSRVNHELTKTWEVSRKSILSLPSRANESRLRDESMEHAQHLIEFAANKPEHRREAEAHATALIRAFCEQLGWEVSIDWEDVPATQCPTEQPATSGSVDKSEECRTDQRVAETRGPIYSPRDRSASLRNRRSPIRMGNTTLRAESPLPNRSCRC
jgi:hypothetical protein